MFQGSEKNAQYFFDMEYCCYQKCKEIHHRRTQHYTGLQQNSIKLERNLLRKMTIIPSILTWGCISVILVIIAFRLFLTGITISRDTFTWRTWWIICIHACSSRCSVCFRWTLLFHPIIDIQWTSCNWLALRSESSIHCVS